MGIWRHIPPSRRHCRFASPAIVEAILSLLHQLGRSRANALYERWCSGHRWLCPWMPLPFLKAPIQARLLPSTLGATLCSLRSLSHPHLVIGLTTFLPLGFCTHGLLCRSLAHLSASPHHMLGYRILISSSGSPHSPIDDPPTLRLPSPKWHRWALVGPRMISWAMRLTAATFWLQLNALQLHVV